MKFQTALKLIAWLGCLVLPQLAHAEPKTVVVEMFNFRFEPDVVTIAVGDTVTWVNRQGSHDVQSDQPLFKSPPPPVQTFSHTFTQPGTFSYRCNPHAARMRGTIIVESGVKIPPNVQITSPAEGAMLQAPATVTLGAAASDEDGSVAEIAFFRVINDEMELLGTASGRGNTLTLPELSAGLFTFLAQAKDNDGETALSEEVRILVYDPFRLEGITRKPGGETILTLGLLPQWARFIPQASTDLADWNDLAGEFLPNGQGTFDYVDDNPDGSRFYRVRLAFPDQEDPSN